MNNFVHTLTDAFALASVELGKGGISPPSDSAASNVLFNVWVIEW